VIEPQNLPRRRQGALSVRTFQVDGDFFCWTNGRAADGAYREEDEDVERLLRDVLPNHPTIERIQLAQCPLPARYVGRFASSSPAGRATPRLELTLHPRDGDHSYVQDICDMLRRDVPLRAMSLIGGLPSKDCRLIFHSLAANTYLGGLAIDTEVVDEDMLCLVSESAPALRALHVQGRFTPTGVESAARQRRTNTALVELNVSDRCRYERVVDALSGSLETFNFYAREGSGRVSRCSSAALPLQRAQRVPEQQHQCQLAPQRADPPGRRAAPDAPGGGARPGECRGSWRW
jgi:hypothetical protein